MPMNGCKSIFLVNKYDDRTYFAIVILCKHCGNIVRVLYTSSVDMSSLFASGIKNNTIDS